MQCIPHSKAGLRYISRLAPTMAIYLIVLFISRWSFHHLQPTGLVVYLLAILPALPLIAALAIVGLYIAEESDEFERSIVVQSVIWGLGGALSVGTIWGSLEDFANAPHLSFFYVFLSFWIFMAISQPFIRMRYR
jgi:xanthosine utilization system XapX-like protein